MTNRRCGTCRFYEVSPLQTHGWCRNMAYPRRDDVALLRETELGCRSGWDKDYWEMRGSEAPLAAAPTAPFPGSQVPAGVGAGVLVGVGVVAEVGLVPLPVTARDAAVAGASAEAPSARRRGFQDPPMLAAPAAPPVASAGSQEVVNLDARLGGHPELGHDGVPLPRVRRSAVHEAHKRALARREEERVTARQRGVVLPDAETLVAASEPKLGQVVVTPGPNEWPLPERAADARVRVPAPPRTPPPPPVLTPAPAEVLSVRPELIDHVIAPHVVAPVVAPVSAQMEATMQDVPRDVSWSPQTGGGTPSTPPAPPAPPAPTLPVSGPLPALSPSTAEPLPVPGAGEARYWDAPGAPRFSRLRDAVTEPMVIRPEARTAQQVGRQRPETPVPSERLTGERGIRPAGAASAASTVPDGLTTPRPGRTLPMTDPRRVAAAAVPAEMPQRHIDESLLRQLETDWRTRALEAHAGQRCGTCRSYQSGDSGEQGTCGCAFAGSYRRNVEGQELACLSALGTWWAATDEGWLQRVEHRRPRRATPLLDALLREYEEAEAAQHPQERQRSAR